MDWPLVLMIAAGAAAAAILGLRQARDDLAQGVLPKDIERFRAYYEPRGYKVLSARRVGRLRGRSRVRDGPIRTYDLELELPDGRRETWLRGVARREGGGHALWRVNRDGKPEQLF